MILGKLCKNVSLHINLSSILITLILLKGLSAYKPSELLITSIIRGRFAELTAVRLGLRSRLMGLVFIEYWSETGHLVALRLLPLFGRCFCLLYYKI